MSAPHELKLLRELSARLGANPLLVQASTGNTSVKVNGVLWIKASGKWLTQADHDDFLVPVELGAARSGDLTNVSSNGGSFNGGRCASIETAMHAVLPHAVVIHVHSVNVIAWAVRRDAERQLAVRLDGLRWQWIPYTPSGVPLAQRIEQAVFRARETNVLVLGNHGLVICADTCAAAEVLLAEVEERLRLEPRPTPGPAETPLLPAAPEAAWYLPRCSRVSALATDPHSRKILAGGVLYPCQAIFLPGTTPARDGTWTYGNHSGKQPFFLVEEQGVRISRHVTRAEFEILNGLAEVVQRIDSAAKLRYLEETEVRSVLDEGASSYRRTADPDYASAAAN
ncbi:MAG TPA: class II aldolase/adducin family protein [Bryobacteraceae bacterium]|nr:class II aldolase/adducin family protein [Bryobacteraceae bacterium]